MARDWPDARGIWHNDRKNFLVWVNEEDHSRVISMQQGGNMREVFTRFCNGLKQVNSCWLCYLQSSLICGFLLLGLLCIPHYTIIINNGLLHSLPLQVEALIQQDGHEFMWSEHLGYILTCPSNLGTGLRAGVHIKIPHVSKVHVVFALNRPQATKTCIYKSSLPKHPKFDAVLQKMRLQKRGTGGVDTAAQGGVFDISNVDRLGKSEVEQFYVAHL